ANGLPDETVNAFLEDRRGDLWLGTDLGGLIKWSAEGFVSYDRDDGLGYASSAAFFTGAAGELYVTSAQRAFVQRFDGDDVDGGRFTAVQLALPAPAARAARREHAPLLLDRAGAWWVGTSRGLFRFPAAGRIEELAGRQPEAVFTRRDGLPAAPIHGLFEDRRGDVWMATRAPGTLAVWRRSRDAVEVVRPAVAPPAAHPTVFAEAGGALWIGWSDGSLLTERRGTFARRASAPAAVSDLYTDPRGRLWVGTAGRGLHAWHPGGAHGGGRLSAVRAGPLRHASVRTVVADAAGRLHVGTTGGVFRHDPDDSSTRALGRTAGLPLGEVLAASRDRHGLWFATLGGVSRLAAGAVPRSPAPAPRAWIGRVAVDGEPWFEAPAGSARIGELRIEPFHRQLRVDLLASLGAAGAPRFQVRLDGRGPWSEASAERSVLLANLPPGSHRLAVRAVDGAGRAGAPTELRFEVIPPLWRRPWFLVLAAALVAAALLAVHRVRLERALALERVRTRIASDLHDEIGSSLARVSVLSEVARRQLASAPEASAGLLAEIGATARELIGVTGDIALSIDPRRSSLASLLARLRRFASDLLEGSGVGLVLEHRGEDPEAVELSPEQRRHLLAALQEMLHNVLRHAGASRVTISVASGPRSLEITVADDGCGLASAPGDPTPGDGQGLANVAARAAALGGRAHLDSTPGRGARWRLDIPRRVPRRGEHDRASVRWPPPW
ncbi:MAG TPA: two-component regulator propeller domain-containing protein, partial [Thermoanaerobaculia bacterium]|nr:two-component regulator propeller domain-containing protein [Thermoanaerobaculia bacterium]